MKPTRVNYVSNGSQLIYAFPFDYLRKKFITVTVNDVALTYGVDYTVNNKEVILTTAITNNSVIVIERITTTDSLVGWHDATVLTAHDLTIAEVQRLHLSEELHTYTKYNALIIDDNGNFDAHSKRIVNVKQPQDSTDAVNKSYIDNDFANIVVNTLKNSECNAYLRTIKATTAPTDTTALWLDTSVTPNVLKWYNTTNSTWISDYTVYIRTIKATTAPTDTTALWLDTSVTPNVLKWYNNTNSTWVSNGMPTGTLIDYAGSTVPAGYLVCNGSAVSRTTYAKLFMAIGTTYGTGDGSTTFTLPNLIDRVKQGSTTVGTYKSAGLPDITGGITWYGNRNGCPNGSSGAMVSGTRFNNVINTVAESASGYSLISNVNFAASVCNAIYGNSTTVQPPALTVLPCIKY